MTFSDKLDCGHEATPTYYTAGSKVTVGNRQVTMTGREVLFPGYATTPKGERLCYGCADSRQAEEMATAQRFTAYLSDDGSAVTTWSGGVLGRVVRLTRNERQTFVRVRDADGRLWAGVGPAEAGTYVSLRRIKG